jgi:hypothetical protein
VLQAALSPFVASTVAEETFYFPEGAGALRPEAFASMGLGVDHAR